MKTRRATVRLVRQLAAYLLGGGLYFWGGYAVFFVCDKGLGLSLWWSKLLANFVGLTLNFLVQRFLAFTARHPSKHIGQVTWRFILITGINFIIDYIIVWSLKEKLHVTPYIGQFVSSGFFTIWNYFWYKNWVFKAPHRHIMKKQPVKKTSIHSKMMKA